MNKFYRCNNFVLILVGMAISAFGIMIPILYTNNEVDGTNVSNSIQFLTLLVGIATIAYVIKTFQLQRKQIEDNNRNTEFNRVLDLIYKQLEFTNQKHLNRKEYKNGLIKLGERLSSLENYIDDIEITNLLKNTQECCKFLEIIKNDLRLLEDILYNNNLSRREINTLHLIVRRNYFEYLGNITGVINRIDNYHNGKNKQVIKNRINDNPFGDEKHIAEITTRYKQISPMIKKINKFLKEEKTENEIIRYRIKLGHISR